MSHSVRYAAGLCVAGYGALQLLGRQAGSIRQERRQMLAGDASVLHSTTHVPPSWRDKFGAAIDWTWSFHLTGLPDDRTRLHVRVRGRAAPWWLAAAYITAIIPADFIMATGMLRGLKRRAEQTCIARVPVRPAADPSWPGKR